MGCHVCFYKEEEVFEIPRVFRGAEKFLLRTSLRDALVQTKAFIKRIKTRQGLISLGSPADSKL